MTFCRMVSAQRFLPDDGSSLELMLDLVFHTMGSHTNLFIFRFIILYCLCSKLLLHYKIYILTYFVCVPVCVCVYVYVYVYVCVCVCGVCVCVYSAGTL